MLPSTGDAFATHVQLLRRRLAEPLPGRRAMRIMQTSHRPFVPVEQARAAGCREAGTLALLFPREGQARTVLTLRSHSLANHGGQVSFPGGALEPGEDVATCALREAREELGVELGPGAVLGQLSALYVPPSGFCVTPVVAAMTRQPRWRPDPVEVAEVIEVPIAHLDRAHRRVENREIRGRVRRVPFYDVGSVQVWGATATILSELALLWQESAAQHRRRGARPTEVR